MRQSYTRARGRPPAWGREHQERVPPEADICRMSIGQGFSTAALVDVWGTDDSLLRVIVGCLAVSLASTY